MQIEQYREWYAGLKALSHADFPKHCACCGRIYQTEEDYFHQTMAIGTTRTGLKCAQDDDESLLLELYRNCVCGSTLLAFFSDRRDPSAAGQRRRHLFDELLDYLLQTGVEANTARSELLRVIHGERSEVLESWYASISTGSDADDPYPPAQPGRQRPGRTS